MGWAPKELKTSHHEMIRMSFRGMNCIEIAEQIGLSPVAVRLVLASPLAQAELARMQEQANNANIEIPLKMQLQQRLNAAADDAVMVGHHLLMDPSVQPRTRAVLVKYFADRVIFNKTAEDEKTESYREILRQLSDIKQTLGESSMLLPPVNEAVAVSPEGNSTDNSSSSSNSSGAESNSNGA